MTPIGNKIKRLTAVLGVLFMATHCALGAPTSRWHKGNTVSPTDWPSHAKAQALAPHFVRQLTDTSCSVATVTTVLNAALAARGRRTLGQEEVVRLDATGAWAQATVANVGPGVDLDSMALLTLRSFWGVGLKQVTVDAMHVLGQTEEVFAAFRFALQKNEQSVGNDFIVLNFNQAFVMRGGADVGHMSVAAAFDERRDRVLVMDVDEGGIPPYWVSVRQLVRAMHTRDEDCGQTRGYLDIRLGR